MTNPAGGVTLPELLSCPFCGAAPRAVDYCGWEIHCKCGVNFVPGEQNPTYENAAAAWNTRAALAGEWRDVRETMPEWGRQVLVWGHDGIDLAGHDGRGVWMDNAGRFLDGITHWHDSPAPPPAAPLPKETP